MTDSHNSIIKRLRIVKVTEEAPDTKTFVLEALDGWQPQYSSGQFLTLVFYTKHGEKRRSYSITSSPALQEPLSITVKKIENGEFSRALVYNFREGDTLLTSGISGFFKLDEDQPAPHYCFLAAGSGITPCFSMIKTLMATTTSSVLLFYSNRNEASVIFSKQLKELAERYGARLIIHYLYSDHHDLYHRRLGKWLLDQLLDRYLGEKIPHTQFYLCGPFDFMQMAEITLMNRSDRSHIRKENFSQLPRLILPKPPDEAAHNVIIHIGGRTQTVSVKYPLSITKSAGKQGLELPYSCEAGRCGSCIATCISGQIWMAYNEVLTDREVNAGRFLACQGFAVGGDAEIRF